MIMQIENVLTSEAVAQLRMVLLAESGAFQAGAATAGWHAREVKRNEQSTGPAVASAIAAVQAALAGTRCSRPWHGQSNSWGCSCRGIGRAWNMGFMSTRR